MEQFIIQFPGVAVLLLYGALLLIISMIGWGLKKLITMLGDQNKALKAQDTTLARIESKTNDHGSRIRSLEFHAWGREPKHLPGELD